MRIRILTPSRLRRSAAFTLVEATIGMSVMGTCVAALFSGFLSGFFTMQLARENQRATQIMLEKVETLRLYSWDQITDAGFIPPAFTNYYDPQSETKGLAYIGAMEIANAPIAAGYSNDLKIVTVTLNWQTGSLPRTRSFTTLVAHNGLQSYIY